VLGAALAFLAGALWTAYDHDLIVKDSGVQACEDLRDNRAGYDRPMTERDYLALRNTFEDSRYDDIREHGTQLVDVAWQVSRQSGDEQVVEALAEHATGLRSACADQGIIVNLS
jgi:hypothetical protein